MGIGDGVKACVDGMSDGDVILLENTRFYKEEEKNVPEFAEKLAANADMFVNDAFGTAHRAHGSTEGVTKFLDTSVAGFLLQKELDYLDGAASARARRSSRRTSSSWRRSSRSSPRRRALTSSCRRTSSSPTSSPPTPRRSASRSRRSRRAGWAWTTAPS